MEYDEQQSAVTYHSDKPTGPTAGSETSDALEFLAKLTSLLPNKGQVLQLYCGQHASRVRGMRRKVSEADEDYEEHPAVTLEPRPEAIREAKKRWAELLRHIFEVDPLACPRCGVEMRIISFITEPKTIDRILEHLRRPLKPHAASNAQRPDAGNRRPVQLPHRTTLKSPDVRRSGDRWVARVCQSDYRTPPPTRSVN